MKIKVSVVIPSYNRVKMIGRAIESVRRQTGINPVEIIVVDDGSTDGTKQFIRENYAEVHLLEQANLGAPVARNRGIRHAAGEYIALLDSDDELTAHSLASRAAMLDQNPDVDLICGNYENCTDGQQVGGNYFEHINLRDYTRLEPGNAGLLIAAEFFDAQLHCAIGLTSALMVRRSALTDGMLFNEALQIGQDWEFCLRFSQTHKVGVVFDIVAKRYVHGGNLVLQKHRAVQGVILLDRTVLAYPWLTAQQKLFMRMRLADDLYEAAYFAYWREKDSKTAMAMLVKSIRMQVTWPKVKLLVGCCIPKMISARLASWKDDDLINAGGVK